jgi:dihydrodipicolinate synthase/N-acetylneuraminate lyase
MARRVARRNNTMIARRMTSAKRYRQCILATCCVPWNERFELEEDIFRRSVKHLINHGIHDLYIFGTAGEGYAVTETQFDEITRLFLEETQGEDVRPMIGIISMSLPTVIERITRAREMGAFRFQLSLPSWGVLRDGELDTFFRETCGRFPDCEFLHYNLARTGRIITGTEYGRLAERHPNLVATKNSTTDEARLESLIRDAPQLQHFITEGGFALASMMGECGFLISIASINLQLGQRYFRAGVMQDKVTLNEMSRELEAMVAEMKGIVSDSAHMDGAYDKMFCRVHDPKFPLRLLLPYSSVSEETFARFVDELRASHPRWLSGPSSP